MKRILICFFALAILVLMSRAGAMAQAKPDHGTSVQLGTVKVAGLDFTVLRFGEVLPGKEGAFAVELASGNKSEISKINLYLWVEDEAGNQLSAPAKGTPEGSGLHFHVTPKAGSNSPKRVVLRVRREGTDERGNLPLDGHGHEHAKTPRV